MVVLAITLLMKGYKVILKKKWALNFWSIRKNI